MSLCKPCPSGRASSFGSSSCFDVIGGTSSISSFLYDGVRRILIVKETPTTPVLRASLANRVAGSSALQGILVVTIVFQCRRSRGRHRDSTAAAPSADSESDSPGPPDSGSGSESESDSESLLKLHCQPASGWHPAGPASRSGPPASLTTAALAASLPVKVASTVLGALLCSKEPAELFRFACLNVEVQAILVASCGRGPGRPRCNRFYFVARCCGTLHGVTRYSASAPGAGATTMHWLGQSLCRAATIAGRAPGILAARTNAASCLASKSTSSSEDVGGAARRTQSS